MRCDQEDCPFWDGDGCPCSVLDITAEEREKAKRAYRNVMGHDWDEQ